MMGRAHALSGIAAGLGVAPLVADVTGWFTLDTRTWLLAGVMTAGAALAPDLDHPGSSSASNALKPVTTVLSNAVALVSFGHRKGTHSLLGIALAALGMLLLTQAFSPWGPLVVCFFLTAFAAKALDLAKLMPRGILRRMFRVIVSAAVTYAVYLWSDGDYRYLLFAVGFGTFIHVLGDFITIGGVPWLWPLSQRNFRLLAIEAGGTTEHIILTPLFIVLIAWFAVSGLKDGEVLSHPVTTPTAVHATSTTVTATSVTPTPSPSPTKKTSKSR